MRVILASASPGRLGVLRAAGVEPLVHVSGVDEAALAASLAGASPAELVTALAEAKATAVATAHRDGVVIGCDSMLHIDGELVGKPGTAPAASAWWGKLSGRTGHLLTGHSVVRVAGAAVTATASGAESTLIRFGAPAPAEIDAYVGTGEPLHVAGGFTIDGLGGWFVDGIEGNPSSVIGLSLPLTRRLLADVGVAVTALWNR